MIYKVEDKQFGKYGKIVEGIDFSGVIAELKKLPMPEGVIYEPSIKELETLPVQKDLQMKSYGELPIQIGYCIGHNTLLNAVEYHRSSEINIAASDAILIIGMQQDITDDFTYDTSKMEAFLIREGTAVELYATALHYAPCETSARGFLMAVVLPAGTNDPLEKPHSGLEDKLITAKNKWLIGHPDAGHAAGTHIGLIGKNLDVRVDF
ncbi:MAG: DUF4867 family protein [Eubacteriales bacterium]